MDEIEILASRRADLVPAQDTVVRHRRQLRALIDASDGATYMPDAIQGGRGAGTDEREEVAAGSDIIHLRPGDLRGDRRRRRGVRLAVAAAALAVVAGAGVVAVLRGDGGNGREPAAVGTDPQAPVGTGWPGCGADAPMGFVAPDGYTGPVVGSSPDATRATTPQQCALHWTSATGSIDVRFPVDHEHLPDAQASCDHLLTIPKEDREFTGYGADLPAGAAPTGRDGFVTIFVMPPDADGSCSSIQLTVYDNDLARARAVERDMSFTIYDPRVPLVRESREAETVPEVGECGRGAGREPEVPNLGGPVTGLSAEATPADALRAFLETQGTPGSDVPRALSDQGYLELTLPDGSIAYAMEHDGGFVGTIIHVVRTSDGWTVDSWEASGC